MPSSSHVTAPAPRWQIVLAFALIYLCWGTTYLAIGVGVRFFPPALFGGTRCVLAGVLMLGGLKLLGFPMRLSPRELAWTAFVSMFLFVGGNGLITLGESTVPSGLASVLVTTTPLWLGLIELVWPTGERLSLVGWLGVCMGMLGVFQLLGPRVQNPALLGRDIGPYLVLGSSICWAIGSFLVRHHRHMLTSMASAAYQMIFGGLGLTAIGLTLGESALITRESFTPSSIYAYVHLLIFGSLIGFVAYNWLLRHVSTSMAGTYAYVNPVIALFVGWLLNGEPITMGVVGGMAAILLGVGLVKTGAHGGDGGSAEEATEFGVEPLGDELETVPSEVS